MTWKNVYIICASRKCPNSGTIAQENNIWAIGRITRLLEGIDIDIDTGETNCRPFFGLHHTLYPCEVYTFPFTFDWPKSSMVCVDLSNFEYTYIYVYK